MSELAPKPSAIELTVYFSLLGLCFPVCKNGKPGGPLPALAVCDSTLKLVIHLGPLSASLGKMVKASSV